MSSITYLFLLDASKELVIVMNQLDLLRKNTRSLQIVRISTYVSGIKTIPHMCTFVSFIGMTLHRLLANILIEFAAFSDLYRTCEHTIYISSTKESVKVFLVQYNS